MRKLIYLFIILFNFTACVAQDSKEITSKISLPEGFKIHVFADEVENARSLALGNKGTVFVGNRTEDKVYALIDSDGDYIADRKVVIAQGLNMPNGVAFYKGDLYVAEVSKI